MNNNTQAKNPKEIFQEFKILHLALIAGQLMMFAVLYFFVVPVDPVDNGSVVGGFDSMSLIAVLIFVALVGASFFMYDKRKAAGAQLRESLKSKTVHYRASFVLRAALLEGANLTTLLVYFFVQKNIVLLFLFALGVALFLMIRPSVDQFIQDYELSGSEQSELRNSTL